MQREISSPRTFCNKKCQWKFYQSISLRTGPDAAGPTIDDSDVIGLQCTDGYRVRITMEQALQCQTIVDQLEATDDDTINNYIQVDIPSDGLKLLIDLLRNNLSPEELRRTKYDSLVKLATAGAYMGAEDIMWSKILPIFILYLDISKQWLINNSDRIQAFIINITQIIAYIPRIIYLMNNVQYNDFANAIRYLSESDAVAKTKFAKILFILNNTTADSYGWHVRKVAATNDVKTMSMLQKYHFDWSLSNSEQTKIWGLVFEIAVSNRHIDMINYLMNDPRISAFIDISATLSQAVDYLPVLSIIMAYPSINVAGAQADLWAPALNAAVIDGNVDMIVYLLNDQRISEFIDIEDALGLTVDDLPLFSILFSHPSVDVDIKYNVFLKNMNDVSDNVAKLILEDENVDPSQDNGKLFLKAVEKSKTNIVRLILNDSRVDPSVLNNHAIRLACISQNNDDIIIMLLDDVRVDPNLIPERRKTKKITDALEQRYRHDSEPKKLKKTGKQVLK